MIVRKKKWYLLKFKWDSTGKWRLAKNEAGMFMNTSEGTQKIERLSSFQSLRILGVWIDPDGPSNKQTIQLMSITTAWDDRVISGHIIKTDAWYYYKSKIKN